MADCSHPKALTRTVCQRCDDDVQAQVTHLEADLAAKDTALESVRRRCELASSWSDEVARRLAEDLLGVIARAALSDAGEGWLPPEVGEWMIAAGERVWKLYGLASWAIYTGKREEGEVAREFRAALDALKVE